MLTVYLVYLLFFLMEFVGLIFLLLRKMISSPCLPDYFIDTQIVIVVMNIGCSY